MVYRLVVALVLLASAAIAQDVLEETYLLRPGDRIAVSVLEDPNIGGTLLVRPDGRVSLPLAGTLSVAGRTPEQAQAAIRAALAGDFVLPPTVTVALVSVGSGGLEADEIGAVGRVYVLGQVGRPGVFDVALPLDILQALALAGGPGPFAAVSRIQVRRREGGGEAVLLFDYGAVEDGATPIVDIALRDGDVIVVPERGLFE